MQTENKPGDQNRNIFARYWAWHKKRAAIAKEKEKQKTLSQKSSVDNVSRETIYRNKIL